MNMDMHMPIPCTICMELDPTFHMEIQRKCNRVKCEDPSLSYGCVCVDLFSYGVLYQSDHSAVSFACGWEGGCPSNWQLETTKSCQRPSKH